MRCAAWRSGAAALWLAAVPAFPNVAVAATSCAFSSVTSVNFGAYNVFDAAPNTQGVGSLTIDCKGGGGPFVVTLGTGQSNSYCAREMRSGTSTMRYNLFTSPARNRVWGDGSGGSSTMTLTKNSNTTLSIHGWIPAGQDVAVGIYTDNVVSTVEY